MTVIVDRYYHKKFILQYYESFKSRGIPLQTIQQACPK